MLEFLKFQPRAFGLDISDFSLKIAQFKKKRQKFVLASWLNMGIPPGIIERGIIKKEAELAEILKEAKRNNKGERILGKYAVCSLPEEEAFFRVVQLPPGVRDEEVNQILKYELEAYIPLKTEELYYDFQILPALKKPSVNTNALIAAIPKKIVNPYISVLKKSGIHPCVLEIESQATVRALIPGFQSLNPVIVLDIGASGTGWTIFSGETILLTGHINISGANFNELIARNLNTDFKKAEDLKKKIGLQEGKKEDKVREALIPILTDLAEQIKNVIDFFREQGRVEYAPDGNVGKILLCGGDSLIKGLPEFLEQSLNMPVELGNPWVNIQDPKDKKIPFIPGEEALAFTTAFGLALRGINIV